jgi:uncharacterized membrane protein (DUF373 family)
MAGRPVNRWVGLVRELGHAEVALYGVVAVLLLVAAGFTLVGTVVDLIEGSGSRRISDSGVFLLDRILLLFIVAELLYTVRLVSARGRVLVEPFLFIGLIAVVRRTLVITAEADFNQSKSEVTYFLAQIGSLAALGLVFAVAIHLLRGSAREQP